ncbi:hypothetical protein [Desulfogranum mediterraneum]|uniref:hypothetical protein n=1 Tax=Desulfogranum mediterraneum TaxID=160661 RepID=UPI0003FF6B6C|nr:hypothetical protein [Desulfogranum mediterraneum]
MLNPQQQKNGFLLLLAGCSVLALLLLSGAGSHPPTGRYAMEVVVRDRSTQIYVLDTTTGAVKWVDAMDTPFSKLKGN